MPIYNTPKEYLKEAIESILNQTFTDFEFLILNDSPDNVELDEIVASYKDKRIKYSKNKKNLGITPSRNKLIDMAKGEYLAVMDHDDISLSERFEKEVAYLDDNPDVGVVSCNIEEFPQKELSKNPCKDADIKLALMRRCVVVHPASMIRKSVLDDNKIRYEERFSPAEDYALWCRLIPYTQFHNLKEVLFKYRVYSENTSTRQKSKMDAATLAVYSFVAEENPILYQEFLLKATNITRVRLFGFIPLLKIVKTGYKTKVYLFDIILLLKYKQILKFEGK